MIEIYQQKMAIVLTVAIQALVVGGLIACIVVGTQDRPSPMVSSAGGTGSLDYRPESASPAAYPIVGHQPEVMPVSISPVSGEELISFRV